MASRRVLRDTVVLYNFVGEINDEAAYQETVFEHCYCRLDEGASLNSHGHASNDRAILYVFDKKTIAKASDGSVRTYLPYDEWKKLADKSAYWTLSDAGNDYFVKIGSSSQLRVSSFSHKVAGSARMWHFEVKGR